MERERSDRKTASFEEFKAYTIAVVRGDQAVDPAQPKIWVEPTANEGGREGRLDSPEAEAKR